MVPFKSPGVGPSNSTEEEKYHDLEHSFQSMKYSSCVGWVISLGKHLTEEGLQFVREIRGKLHGSLNGWTLSNFAILLFFVKEVSHAHIVKLASCPTTTMLSNLPSDLHVLEARLPGTVSMLLWTGKMIQFQ